MQRKSFILKNKIDPSSKSFQVNASYMQKQVKAWEEAVQKMQKGGGSTAHQKQKAKNKFPVRERIAKLIDSESQFLEFSSLAAWGMYEGQAPCGGLVTGIGCIHGQECVLIANDPTVKGGTYFPITAKKHLRAQEIALENHLPCLYLVDCGGAYLPLQAEVFPDRDHFGRVFYYQAQMSAKGIPQIALVLGSCTAGGAYIPAMSDENIIVKGNGSIFLGGPPLVKAATGEEVGVQELGGAEVHCQRSGVCDHYAENEEKALAMARHIVQYLPRQKSFPFPLQEKKNPLYDPEDIYGLIPQDPRCPYEVKQLIARLVDGSVFHEFKANYGTTLICGFAHLWGIPVGIIANEGILFSESALKACHFIQMCEQRNIPLIFLQNITGFMVGKKYENQGIAKDGAKMVMAVSNVRVPKFTVIIGGSYGAGNYGMCGRAYQPRQLWMWPNARISVMGGAQASEVLLSIKRQQATKAGKVLSPQEEAALSKPILEKYERESSAYYSTARIWDDGIIDPKDTRRVLALGLHASFHRPWHKEPQQQGVFRM